MLAQKELAGVHEEADAANARAAAAEAEAEGARAALRLLDSQVEAKVAAAVAVAVATAADGSASKRRPAATAEAAAVERFQRATAACSDSSPIKALFLRIAAHDPSITALDLNHDPELMRWTAERQSAAFALVGHSPCVCKVSLAGLNLTDDVAPSVATMLRTSSAIEVRACLKRSPRHLVRVGNLGRLFAGRWSMRSRPSGGATWQCGRPTPIPMRSR